jgi:hypothetical protein
MRLGVLIFIVAGCVGPATSPASAQRGASLVIECDETTALCVKRAAARCPTGYRVLEKEKTRRNHDLSFYKDPTAPLVYVDHFAVRVQCL